MRYRFLGLSLLLLLLYGTVGWAQSGVGGGGQSGVGGGAGGSNFGTPPASPNGVTFIPTDIPAAGAAVLGWSWSGVTLTDQTCASPYTLQPTDRSQPIEVTSSSSCTVNLPDVGGANFQFGYFTAIINSGSGTVTLARTSASTICVGAQQSSCGTTAIVSPGVTMYLYSNPNNNWRGVPTGSVAPVTSTTSATAPNPTINTDTKLMELSIPAGYFNTLGQPYLIQGGGTYNTTSAAVPALTYKIKISTGAACTGTCITVSNIVTAAVNTAAQTGLSWNDDLSCVVNAAGATGNLMCKGTGLVIDIGAALSSADTVYTDLNTATSSNIDLTQPLFVSFWVAQSVAGASNSYTQLMAIVAPPSGGPSNGASTTSVTATGTTWWLYTFVAPPNNAGNNVTPVLVANQPGLWLFTLPVPAAITKVTIFLQTGQAASTGDIGVYPFATSGTVSLLWHTGSFATTSSATQVTTAVSGGAITMQPGQYFLAACDSVNNTTWNAVNNSTALEAINAAGPAHTFGTDATDTCTAGVLPSTITVTNITNSASTSYATPNVMASN